MSKAVTKPDQVIGVINNLISTCRDGEKGFAQAAENLEREELKQFCLEQSRTRARFASELQEQVAQLGGSPETGGSVSGAAHRAWLDLKSALGGGDHAIMAACETGEDSAVKQYSEALQAKLPPDVRTLLEKQYQNIQQTHHRVRALRDSLK